MRGYPVSRERTAVPYREVSVSHLREPFAWPVRGEVISEFNAKVGYINNKGIDIKVPAGSKVRAAQSGTVVFKDERFKGYGKTVIIDHGGNYETVYAYNSEILVNLGDEVRQGDLIAKAGRTGRATSPSLHFEIRRDGKAEDPMGYLKAAR